MTSVYQTWLDVTLGPSRSTRKQGAPLHWNALLGVRRSVSSNDHVVSPSNGTATVEGRIWLPTIEAKRRETMTSQIFVHVGGSEC